MAYESLKDFFTACDAFPTTRTRILASVGLSIATGAVYMLHACILLPHGWVPDNQWLLFLLGMAGIDTAQYMSRGYTEYKKAQVTSNNNTTVPDSTMTTDIQELATKG